MTSSILRPSNRKRKNSPQKTLNSGRATGGILLPGRKTQGVTKKIYSVDSQEDHILDCENEHDLGGHRTTSWCGQQIRPEPHHLLSTTNGWIGKLKIV